MKRLMVAVVLFASGVATATAECSPGTANCMPVCSAAQSSLCDKEQSK